MMLLKMVKKKSFPIIFILVILLILITLPCNLLLARKLRTKKKKLNQNFNRHLQISKKDPPKIDQTGKKIIN